MNIKPLNVVWMSTFVLALGLNLVACAKKPADSEAASTTPPAEEEEEEQAPPPAPVTKKYLYVASGLCYSGGGNTTFTAATAANVVFKHDIESGVSTVLADYNNAAAGTTPVGITLMGDNHVGVLVENGTATGARRVDKLDRSGSSLNSYYSYLSINGNNVFSAVLRAMDYDPTDGTLLISKSTGIEKVSAAPNRLMYAANAWVNAPGGACSPAATVISDLVRTPQGHIIYTHANTAQNKVVAVSKNGANSGGGCLAAQAAPVATAFPTSVVYIPGANQILVSYAGNTTANDINSVYAYDVTETDSTLSFSNPVRAYQDVNVLYGVSALAYDSDTNTLYAATANSTATAVAGYNIEKFSYDSSTKTLTRVGSAPMLSHYWATKCISGFVLGSETQ